MSPEFPGGWDDWHRRRVMAERFRPWLERARPLTGATVLEYGCGNGAAAATFAPGTDRYIGIDIDEAAVAQARDVLAGGGLHPEFHTAPPDQMVAVTSAFAGQVDVLLGYAVLEHMSVEERLAWLEMAKGLVRPDGVIAIIETPNRLTAWDYHTSQLPFLYQLPEELVLAYLDRSPRTEFVEAMRAARAQGAEAEHEAFIRWGRGMSFHELELVFGDLSRHVVASNWEPELTPDRHVHRDELALQRRLDAVRPDLPATFSRYWLDTVLTVTPRPEPVPLLRPWALRTLASTNAEYEDELVWINADGILRVELPAPSARLVVVAEAGDPQPHPIVRQAASGEEQHGTDVSFAEPATRYEVRLSEPGIVSLVLYEA